MVTDLHYLPGTDPSSVGLVGTSVCDVFVCVVEVGVNYPTGRTCQLSWPSTQQLLPVKHRRRCSGSCDSRYRRHLAVYRGDAVPDWVTQMCTKSSSVSPWLMGQSLNKDLGLNPQLHH